MNAYELAGRLLEKKLYLIQEGVNSSYLEDASTMLRQQADRIAELEKVIQDGIKTMGEIQEQELIKKFGHPVKQLSDEQIEILASKHLCYQIEDSEVSGVYNFARAIIKEITE